MKAGNSLTTNEEWSVTNLPAPSDMTITPLSDNSSIEVSWTDNSDNESGFEVWPAGASGNGWDDGLYSMASTGPDETSVVLSDLTPDTFYNFEVRVSATRQRRCLWWATGRARWRKARRAGSVAIAASDSATVSLGWYGTSDAVDGYNIYRSDDGGSTFSEIDSAVRGFVRRTRRHWKGWRMFTGSRRTPGRMKRGL